MLVIFDRWLDIGQKFSLKRRWALLKQNSQCLSIGSTKSIELALKRNYTLCLFSHWFQPGHLTSGLKQTPYGGQHNMVSREQQVSWPQSDTIRKERKHTKQGFSELFIHFWLFSFFATTLRLMCHFFLAKVRQIIYDGFCFVSRQLQ